MSVLPYEIRERALFDAIAFCGGVKKYSQLIGATRTQVSNWIKNSSIKMGYQYSIITAVETGININRLSPLTPRVNKIINHLISHAPDTIQIPISHIMIEAEFSDYYRLGKNDLPNNQPILISQDKTLISGYSRWLADKEQNKRHSATRVIDTEALSLGIHTLAELHQNLSIIQRTCVGAYLELTLGSLQGMRSHLNSPVSNHDPSPYSNPSTTKTDTPILSRKQISDCVGFGNEETYRQAKSVVRNGIDQLLRAMDDKHIAIYAAAQIAKQPPEKQRQLLAEKIACV